MEIGYILFIVSGYSITCLILKVSIYHNS